MLAAIALVVTAQPRPSQAGGIPRLAVGRLEVEAGLVVEAHPRTPVKHALVVRGPWRQEGVAVVEEMSGPAYTATLRAQPAADGIELDAVIRYAVPVVIDREAIQLRLPGRARALGRDLAVLQLDRPLRV